MKSTVINVVLATSYIALLALYGYAHSMTADGFIVQGWIGTAIPPVFGAALYLFGFLMGKGIQS